MSDFLLQIIFAVVDLTSQNEIFCLQFIFQSQALLPPLEGLKHSPKNPSAVFCKGLIMFFGN